MIPDVTLKVDELEVPSPLILVVDDEEGSRFLARAALESAGFVVAEAVDGRDALEVFAAVRPQALLLDIMMPELDGFEVCQRIRELPFGACVPILIMTGLHDVESIDRAYRVGATDFIAKPLQRAILPHRMRYMLRSKGLYDSLRESEARLSAAQRLARLGHWEYDPLKGTIDWSQEFESIFGLPVKNKQCGFAQFIEYVHPDDRDRVRSALRGALRNNESYRLEHRLVCPDGTQRFVIQEAQAQSAEDETQRVVGTLQDISEQRRAEEQIRELAYRDNVTGLANRTQVHEDLERALSEAARRRTCLAVLFLDLDRFKRINDTLGHSAGDILLRRVADRLTECIRRSDVVKNRLDVPFDFDDASCRNTVARLGGDEFVVMLAGLERAEHAASVARRICEELRKPFRIGDNEVYVNTSIGISAYPDDGDTVEVLLKNADAAMYDAKAQGRDRYQFYTPSINARALERLVLESDLRKALVEKQFVLHYQPKVCVSTSRVVGMEAMLRWEHPTVGTVSPSEFVPVAAETGLIVPLGEWVLEEACNQAKLWLDDGIDFCKVAVNLSSSQCNNGSLQKSVVSTLAKTKLPAQFLELELTETLLMEHLDTAMTFLTELKAIGVHLAIDDFGTGYSSLGHLKQLPIDSIKIDQCFIRCIHSDPNDASMVSGIITLAHKLGLRVVAEGVEEPEQWEFLRQQECDEAQGYLFHAPAPADETTTWLQRKLSTVA